MQQLSVQDADTVRPIARATPADHAMIIRSKQALSRSVDVLAASQAHLDYLQRAFPLVAGCANLPEFVPNPKVQAAWGRAEARVAKIG